MGVCISISYMTCSCAREKCLVIVDLNIVLSPDEREGSAWDMSYLSIFGINGRH